MLFEFVFRSGIISSLVLTQFLFTDGGAVSSIKLWTEFNLYKDD